MEENNTKDKNFVTQEEVNSFLLNENIETSTEIQNIIILIRNELNTLENQIIKYPEPLKSKIVKRLNKIFNQIIDIRKH
ncbi:MAG: hypothetical protein A2086_08175 [Spirochaetes bacterium GWD1_27_9]|nr:MAG: hypothetical protein A2Y34_13695 [Spirochaetes bacterium GWC1_27_15]OHD34497.1 MAG: hypothetical protein A2086_08175 [Spirochaetes bacterium GWD1_27_9]